VSEANPILQQQNCSFHKAFLSKKRLKAKEAGHLTGGKKRFFSAKKVGWGFLNLEKV